MDPRLSKLRVVIGLTASVILLLSAIGLRVQEGEVQIVTRFGKATRVIEDAGFHWKLPYPIESSVKVDKRKRTLSTRHTEMLTRDKRNIILLSYISWSVVDALLFYQSVGTLTSAEEKLDGLVTNAKIGILGQYDLSALASTDAETIQVVDIENEILEEVSPVALERYGVKIHVIGFSRLSLPKANISSVFTQMRAERKQFASQFQAIGDEKAAVIRADTDLEVAQIRAEGIEEAAKIRGEAEAEAARIYAEAHAKDPELYRFIRSLESLDAIIGTRSSVILRTDADPFLLLTSPK